MSDKYDVEYLEAGDSFEGGPIEQSYFISAVLAAGGEIQITGDKVTIVALPKKEKSQAKASLSEKEEEPKIEELKKEEIKVEEPKKEEFSKAKPGPKSKHESAPEKTEE